MREKTPDMPDIRDVFEKKGPIIKISKKDDSRFYLINFHAKSRYKLTFPA